MSRKQRHAPEQVIGKLREAEVKPARGTAIAQVGKDLSITENTYYRWRREYGGMIEPGSPWEDGYIESFNGELRDELLDREAFDTLLEAKVLIERWRVLYNTVRPHSSLGYRPPAPEAIVPWTPALGASLPGPAAMDGAVVALT